MLTVVPLALLILGYAFPSQFFSDQEAIRDFVMSYGATAPFIFILLQILQVVITPFSHYAVSIAGGFIFGVWEGFLYNWIGRVIGTVIAFYLGRYLGRRLLKHAVKPVTLKKFDDIINRSKWLLFLAYFLPLFPDDEISYLAGASALSPPAFITLIALGHIGGSFGLALLGNGIKSFTDPMFLIFSAVTLLGGLLFLLLWRKHAKSATVTHQK